MGVYNRGRPKKVRAEEAKKIPAVPGEYIIRDPEGKVKYIGETNNLRRRAKEHQKTNKFSSDSTLEYLVANHSDSSQRREHERKSINKHKPSLNRSKGGEGRPANKHNWGRRTNDMYSGELPMYDHSYNSFSFIEKIKWVFRFLRKVLLILIILFFIYYFAIK